MTFTMLALRPGLSFNMVELSDVVGGPVISSYAVQDKVQEAELDPAMIVEDELFAAETWEPCLTCGRAEETHELMYCDGCDKAIHVFCAGFDESPEIWYCDTCIRNIESGSGAQRSTSTVQRTTRPRAQAAQRQPRQGHDVTWTRIWQEVSRRLDFDLDFPFDEETGDQRTEEQRREFARWQRRFEVASQQGASNRLRNIANAQIQQADPAFRPAPESQEELRAWNAFDKARESQDAPIHVRRAKRKRTASPASSAREAEAAAEAAQQKRPRLRRPRDLAPEPEQNGEASNGAGKRATEGPTFLSSLLREVESKPVSASSPGASDQQNGQYSPPHSPASPSPPSSDSGTPPRRLSATPPPQPSRRPLSPPLSSTIVPLASPIGATFSPFSPTHVSRIADRTHDHRRGRHHEDSAQNSEDDVPQDRASSASPSRHLSYSAKEEIQRMVKLAIGTRYRDKEITKDQYTEINRDVSRKLYDLVGSAVALTDQAEREKWQGVADDEVKKAVVAAKAEDADSEE
ncbi:hypothetical protein LTR09_000317 [Extremus antarcticus]|uniref:Zinc finger PHD-type domain-containing protein n=1 Tax=Extremus antarcticus TaxID=702011 RepID=A0AAJ0LX78_9PEZI|nr:hypothetical protein LTR09_000317 [Extremus antarcticus]